MAETSIEPAADPQGIRPLVARAPGSTGVWIFAAILAVAGGGIFYGLQTRRVALQNPSLVQAQAGSASTMISSPPELAIPPAPEYQQPLQSMQAAPMGYPQQPVGYAAIGQPAYQPQPVRMYAPSPPVPAMPQPTPASYLPQSMPAAPGFAYQAPQSGGTAAPDGPASKAFDGRAQAHPFANPGTTVPQGSVIQAVMETALDSTRAGFSRAIVSRDVMSFDGTRVLIPRGSHLFGSYQADISLGQKRALIQWNRLIRPDGMTIDLDSPSADPLGRAGVKGNVNTHFLQRFSGAILQSALDIGVNAASKKVAGNTVIVGLSGSNTQATTIQNPADIKPTLKIPQGASVSVFVARDLDFTSVEH
ncbi:type IV secretion system protein VirB10 [Novosphingobium sp. PhB165]|uniref:TrbI/VirB10 family protein n=1 Tax=Novosphingobium sp. PhB165 TaxID=2485105 RepID=UPI0010D15971|nr:TrbI/VirB10 family protein [Novosphingobium sp. PhB165]TCM15079.1 type IV secretion system protein VirB10 [Novosphingobium sp. PhB165]